jgi:hypothetical protein
MKKSKYINSPKSKIFTILLLFVSLIFGACSSDFIDLEPISNPSVASFYKNEADLEQAVIASYAALQSRGQYAQDYLYFMEVRSDNSYVEDITKGVGEEGNLDLFREVSTNNYLNAVWRVCYAGIYRCNIVLNRIGGIEMDANLKEIRKGEMKFIRALTYFNLVRMWGEVPVVLEEIDNVANAYDHVRQPLNEVYDAIIEDLTSAITALPSTQSDVGRVTKGAAITLLGKVHLTLNNWTDAVTTLKQAETIGYQILPNYADVFDAANENNKESIFEVQFKGGGGLGEGSLFLRLHTPLGDSSLLGGIGGAGVGDNLPTQDLYDAFSDTDLRKPVTIGILADGRLHTNKYNALPVDTNDEDNNFMLLRYSDVLLMLAEASNEVAYVPDGPAFDYVNTIRVRAGLPAFTSANLTNQQEFRDAVLLERRLEFAFENQRWFDLLRTGKSIEVMSNYVETRAPLLISEHHVLFPIPQAQIDIMNSPNFSQNPGY